MFKIHTSDGQTTRIDLTDDKTAKLWTEKLCDPEFQSTITGITIIQTCNVKTKCDKCGKSSELYCKHCGQEMHDSRCKAGVQYSLSKPSQFKDVKYRPEFLEANEQTKMRGGERVVCMFDGIQVVLMAHANQPAIRVSLNKIGKQRYNPEE